MALSKPLGHQRHHQAAERPYGDYQLYLSRGGMGSHAFMYAVGWRVSWVVETKYREAAGRVGELLKEKQKI